MILEYQGQKTSLGWFHPQYFIFQLRPSQIWLSDHEGSSKSCNKRELHRYQGTITGELPLWETMAFSSVSLNIKQCFLKASIIYNGHYINALLCRLLLSGALLLLRGTGKQGERRRNMKALEGPSLQKEGIKYITSMGCLGNT